MAKQFLVSINLNKNEILNARLQNLATAPSNPAVGQIYFDTTDDEIRIWTGSEWISGGSGGGYVLPIASNTTLGGVLAKAKGDGDTVQVAVSDSGRLYVPTYPTISSLGAIASTEKGANNGVATLGADGKVPASQLPSYVDDVIEGYYYNGNFYEDSSHTQQITPSTGIIYVDLSTDKTYRWGGSAYVEISQSTIHKYTETIIGDGATTSFLISHGLSTLDVIVSVYDTTTNEDVMVDVVRNSTTGVYITFATAPAVSESYRVVVIA